MHVLLLGDSHLAYVFRDHRSLVVEHLGEVDCVAFGGATVADLPGQVHGLRLGEHDAVVVSVGSNDVFLGDSPTQVRSALDDFVAQHPGTSWVWVESPNFPSPLGELSPAVATRDLLAPLGGSAFVGDGVHLSRAAYDVLVPAIAEECSR